MAVKTVNAQICDIMTEAVMTAGRTAQAGQNGKDSVESFGDVLSKTLSDTKAVDASDNAPKENTYMSKAEKSDKALEAADKAEPVDTEDDVTDKVSDGETVEGNMFDKKLKTENAEDEPVDEMTTEKIADALSQIIEQIKELLGVSDEEILAGMESIDIRPEDLLSAGSMAQLLTAIAGEGEAISLVTNEELYADLQTLNETVENVSAQLLEDTGLTQEELKAVLEKLKQMENAANKDMLQQTAVEEQTDVMTDAVNNHTDPLQEEADVVVVEDNTKLQETEKAFRQSANNISDELPENQQENPMERTAKTQPQKTEHDAHGQESGSRDFGGQQGMAQSTDDSTNGAEATAQTPASYTSESTESILRQLADVVRIIKNENLTEMELQLHPASLGTVNVSLVTKGGSVTAEFTTQNEAVRAAIESQVSQLMANLEEQGVKVEAVEVSVAGHELEKNLDENNQGEQSRKEQEEKQRIQGARRNSINLNSFADGDELVEEMQGADDATRIAMEMMAANGNSMDLMT